MKKTKMCLFKGCIFSKSPVYYTVYHTNIESFAVKFINNFTT